MGSGSFVEGRNAHEAGNSQSELIATRREKGVSILRQHAGVLGFGARVDLNKKDRLAVLLLDFLPQRLAQAGSIDGMDCIKQSDRVFCLVGLKGADQVQLNTFMLRKQKWPFRRSE